MGHSSMDMLAKVYAKWLGNSGKVIDWVLIHTKDGNNGADFTRLFLDRHNGSN